MPNNYTRKKTALEKKLRLWLAELPGHASHFARWFLSNLFGWAGIKVGLTLLVIFAAYVVYLDATIRSTFEGKKWQLPTRVYARPLELYTGSSVRLGDVLQELNNLGYRRGDISLPGSYLKKTINAKQEKLWVYTRGHDFWDGREATRQVRLDFQSGKLAGIYNLQGGSVPLVRFDPMEIGAISPAHNEDRVLLQLDDIPPVLVAALVAIEDHRFYEHNGISLSAISRAFVANIKSVSYSQGGSTLTQQLVKNYYLSRERSLRRKFTEAIMALLLDARYSKESIIEAYFNEVYLGQSGVRAIHGFGLGAQHYFNRPLHELSIERLALLIAIIRGPAYYDPWRQPERVLERRNFVLARLAEQGLLSEKDAQWAQSQPLNLGKSSGSHFTFPAYLSFVKQQLNEHYPPSQITSEGMRIYTAFDPIVQQAAEQAVSKHLKRLGEEELEASVVVSSPATGEVVAIVGGRRAKFAGFNRALNMRRSIGSVVKPFVYLTALQSRRYTLSSMIDDSEIDIALDDGSIWSPKNYDRESHGQVPLITALAKSYNQASVRLGYELGVKHVVNTLDQAGLGVELNPVPSLLIGTSQLSPLQVAQLYQTLASNGFATKLKAIRSVLDRENRAIQHFPYKVKQVYDEDSMYLTTVAMKEIGQHGSARGVKYRLGSAFTFAGKTGTSSQGRDAWFAGYTGDLLAVVWVGYDDNRASELTGSSAAVPIWSDIMLKNSLLPLTVSPPEGVVFRWVDLPSGKLSTKRCASARYLPYRKGTQPSGRKHCSSR